MSNRFFKLEDNQMGAGISQKDMNSYYYRNLKKLQRELRAVGVDSHYGQFQLSGVGESTNWVIWYSTLRASNGETCGMLKVSISHGGFKSLELYGSERGIARIKELFAKPITEAL
jgi:hypothetical protein